MRDTRELPFVLQSVSSDRISRRSVLKRAAAFGIATPTAMALLAACGGEDDASETPAGSSSGDAGGGGGGGETATAAATASGETPATAAPTSSGATETGTATTQGQGTPGGTLRGALFEEPTTLDIQANTSFETGVIGWNIFETLFAWSDSYELIPMLAESHEVSDDGLLHTVTIRQGVPFHNGQELTTADVIASIKRWEIWNGTAKSMMEVVEEIVKVDDYTIEAHLTEPYSVFASVLGVIYGGCAIYPESVMAAAGDLEITEFIGTGPYKFVSWDRGQAIRIERFEDYAALPGEPNGYGGHKYAYLDAMEFTGVSDEAARVAGLRAGDYDYAERISGDQAPTLEEDENITITKVLASGWDTFVVNWKSSVFDDDLKARQAVQAAMDHQTIMSASRGEGFFGLYASIMPEGTVWYSEAGSELYNIADPERAKQLLAESNYDGSPLVVITTQADLSKYQACVVIKQQLEQVGFTVDLQVFDWATVKEHWQNEPDYWEGLVTKTSFTPDPVLSNSFKLCSSARGWWCSDPSAAAFEGLVTESDFDARYQYWEQLQTLLYEEVPMVYLAQVNEMLVHSNKLKGLTSQAQVGAILWNTWLEE